MVVCDRGELACPRRVGGCHLVHAVLAALVGSAVALTGCSASVGSTRSSSDLGIPATPLRPVPPPTPGRPPPTLGLPPPTSTSNTPPAPHDSGARVPQTRRVGVQRPPIGDCPVFPENHISRAVITELPVHPRSSAMIRAAGPDSSIGAGFGATVWQGSRAGYPINVVDGRTSERRDLVVSLEYLYMSTFLGVPWPVEPRFEGWPGRAWDKHIIIVDTSTCVSWEGINLQPPWENVFGMLSGRWYADAMVTIDLRSTNPPSGSVTAAGFSLLQGLVRYEEVQAGEISHTLSLALPDISPRNIWPALGSDGRSSNPDAPPMGAWFRLREDADLSGLGPQATVVARALQRHGAILTDTGPSPGLAGEPDQRWDDTDLAGLRRFRLNDFDIIVPTQLATSESRHQIP